MKSIVLIGMMGSGKSTIAKHLSAMLGMPLVDTDTLYETHYHMTIADTFRQLGEAIFRKRERELIMYCTMMPPSIIATGGGVVENNDNMQLLQEGNTIVYLECSLDTLWARISGSNRPLATSRERVASLLADRLSQYMRYANITVDASGSDSQLIAQNILSKMVELL